jgi:hypothetical protein
MTWRYAAGIAMGLLLLFGSLPLPPACQAAEPPSDDAPRVVIPFDFESRFDEGRYGRMIGDMIWKKLDRQGGFVIPESMLDVRQWSESHRLIPNPETPLERMSQIVRQDFGGQIGIWGKVERVMGAEFDEYDLWITIADFSADKPRIVHQAKARTKTVSEIPHVYVQAALDRLYDRPESSAEVAANPLAERLWATGPNLVRGDFEVATDKGPVAWDPLPRYVQRVPLASEQGRTNHVLRFQFPEQIAATSGVLLYSDFFPVQENATYRFQCRWRTTGSAAKVFIKCYDELPTQFRDDQQPDASSQRREVYRSQQNLKGSPRLWNVHQEDFTPRHTQFTPRWGRVMLYAYWPEGAVDWDDVVVKQILPPPNDASAKQRRPSLETKVRSEEVERVRD